MFHMKQNKITKYVTPFTNQNQQQQIKGMYEHITPAFNSLSFKLKRNEKAEKIVRDQCIEKEKEKKEFKSKVYGAIIRYKDKNQETYYALIQGRYTGKWSFPKGHSNKGEEPYDCVKREVYEETGIRDLPNPTAEKRIGFGYYYIFDVEIKYELKPQDKKEVMNQCWVTEKELDNLELNVDASYFKKGLVNI